MNQFPKPRPAPPVTPPEILAREMQIQLRNGAMRDDVYDFVRKVQQKERPQ